MNTILDTLWIENTVKKKDKSIPEKKENFQRTVKMFCAPFSAFSFTILISNIVLNI